MSVESSIAANTTQLVVAESVAESVHVPQNNLPVVVAVPIESYFEFLFSDKLYLSIGFLGGICWNVFKSKQDFGKFLNAPLTTLVTNSFSGLLYAWGAVFTAGLLPKYIRPIVPLSIIFSVCRHYKKNIG